MRNDCTMFAVLLVTVGCGSPGKPTERANGGGTAAVAKPVDARTQMVRDLAALRFDKLGNPVLRWDFVPSPRASRERPHKLLVVTVAFPDRGFDRFKGDPNQGAKLVDYYKTQLFDETYERVNSLSHYYANQSGGAYHVTGEVLAPITLSRPRAAYGAPTRPAGGNWRNDADTEGMVEEALMLAAKTYPDVAWSEFDRWDPQDYDKDNKLDEPDGYIDHFVLVFAGGGQSSCQGLYQLGNVFTPNVGPEIMKTLDERQRECAERLWPHRFKVQRREGQGPTLAGVANARGGVGLSKTLWVSDYNMQSEYITNSTFIHEFGHSLGLPDVYSRTSSNSTGVWEVMSATASPSPQNLSAWSRLQLGWLKPQVVLPPEFGGATTVTTALRLLDGPGPEQAGAERAVMVVLPPKVRTIELTTLPAASGERALYSGQGNEMNRWAQIELDLTAAAGPVELSFDAWWQIEAGWDFAYVEVAAAGGPWRRLRPNNPKHMPAKHGHDGKTTLPGFTGLSGDLDGDGKNESNPACDPSVQLAHGEDQAGAKKSPCKVATWVRPSFDLSALRGGKVRLRLRYFTDGAAVEAGILIDNVLVTGIPFAAASGNFETAVSAPWTLNGFSRSPGHHELLVPHFYLIEYRDPYKQGTKDGAGGDKVPYRYDRGLTRPYYLTYWNPIAKKVAAAQVRARPGVVVWYYDGAYAWSENDPAVNGPGKGYLLALDANPNEIRFPGLETFFVGSAAARDTHYDVTSPAAQATLKEAYKRTVCFMRNASYMPKNPDLGNCGAAQAPIGKFRDHGKQLMYSYQIGNDYLSGEPRKNLQRAGELFDVKKRKGKTSYRLRDRSLRGAHTLDSPFSVEPFTDGVIFYDFKDGKIVRTGGLDYPAVSRFDDSQARAWQNPLLPFGGVTVPDTGFSFELSKPAAGAPASAVVQIKMSWATNHEVHTSVKN